MYIIGDKSKAQDIEIDGQPQHPIRPGIHVVRQGFLTHLPTEPGR